MNHPRSDADRLDTPTVSIKVRVIEAYSVKPMDAGTLLDAAKISAKHIAAAVEKLACAPRCERDTAQAQRGEN